MTSTALSLALLSMHLSNVEKWFRSEAKKLLISIHDEEVKLQSFRTQINIQQLPLLNDILFHRLRMCEHLKHKTPLNMKLKWHKDFFCASEMILGKLNTSRCDLRAMIDKD